MGLSDEPGSELLLPFLSPDFEVCTGSVALPFHWPGYSSSDLLPSGHNSITSFPAWVCLDFSHSSVAVLSVVVGLTLESIRCTVSQHVDWFAWLI